VFRIDSVQFIQVKLTKISSIGTSLKFGLYRISLNSEFSFDSFCCIYKVQFWTSVTLTLLRHVLSNILFLKQIALKVILQ